MLYNLVNLIEQPPLGCQLTNPHIYKIDPKPSPLIDHPTNFSQKINLTILFKCFLLQDLWLRKQNQTG